MLLHKEDHEQIGQAVLQALLPLSLIHISEPTRMLMENEKIMIVREPVFIDKTTLNLCDRMKRWVEWANQAKESDYNPFATDESTGDSE